MFNYTKYHYLLIGISFIIIVVSVVYGLRKFTETRDGKTVQPTGNATSAVLTDSDVLLKVGKHVVLPVEQPKIITISNVEDLAKQQAFFSQAKNGDKLLIYATKVILFDPDRDKVVDIAQIRIDTTPTPAK